MLIISFVLNNIVINVWSGARSNFFKQGQKAAKTKKKKRKQVIFQLGKLELEKNRTSLN